MIDYISGALISKQPTYAVIDVNGIGYGINIPLSTYAELADINCVQRIFVWLYVREDALQLFGFAAAKEREIFKMLIGVSGVGPRMALGVLSAMSSDDFLDAIRNGDIALLTSVPGIGRKKAERLLLELKDRAGEEIPRENDGARPPGEVQGNQFQDAVSALMSLGCRYPEASTAVKNAVKALGSGSKLEDIIKESLKGL